MDFWVRGQQPQPGAHQQCERANAGAGSPLRARQRPRREHIPAKLHYEHLRVVAART